MKVSRKLGRRSRRRTLRNRAKKHTHKRGKRFHRGGVNSPVLLKYKKNAIFSIAESKHFNISIRTDQGFVIILTRVENPIKLFLYCDSLNAAPRLPDLTKIFAATTQNSYDFSFADNTPAFNAALNELQTVYQEQRQKQDQQKQEQQTQQQQIDEAADKMKKLEDDLKEIPDAELIIGLFSTSPTQDDAPVNFSVFKKEQEDLASSIKKTIDEDATSEFSEEDKEARKRTVDTLLDTILTSQRKLMSDTYLLVKGYDTISPDIRTAVAEKLYRDYLVNNLKKDTPETLADIKKNIDFMQKTASKETVVPINVPTVYMNPLHEPVSKPVSNRTPPGCTTETGLGYMRSYGTLDGWVPCDPIPEATDTMA